MSEFSEDGWAMPASVTAKVADLGIEKSAQPNKPTSGFASGDNAAVPAHTEPASGFGGNHGLSGFGSKPSGNSGFGSSAPSNGFGATAAAAPTGFGSSASSGFGSKTTTEISGFGAKPSGFGSSTTSTGFAATAAPPAKTTESGFGGSSGFGGNGGSSGFGSKPTGNTGFGSSTSSGFGAPAAQSGFGAKPTETASSGFGSSGGFGAKNDTKGFGGSSGFGSSAATSTGFGATSTGFGGGSSGFGAASTGFGGGSTGFGGGSSNFGATNGGGGGGGSRGCFNCGEEGHRSSDCTEPRKERAPMKCFNCDGEGHRSSDCTEPRKERRGPMTCYNCQQEGHRSSDCTEPRKERGSRPFGGATGGTGFGDKPSGFGSSFASENKSSFGETSGFGAKSSGGFGGSGGFGSGGGSAFGSDKPAFGGAFGGGGGEDTGASGCFHCHSEEHRARDCPTKPPMECHRCKQPGHMSKECTNDPVLAEGEEAKPPKSTFIPDDVTESDLFANKLEKGSMFDKFFDAQTQITSNSGVNAPEKIKNFDDVEFTETVANNIRKSSYTRPTPVQQCAIPIIMGGFDMISVAQTGSGKTAAFLLPVIHHLVASDNFTPSDNVCRPRCIILAPTRELCNQIHSESRKFCMGTVLNTACLYGGTSVEYAKSQIQKGATILVATVGRLQHFITEGLVSTEKVKFFILDEADRMMESDSFGPNVREICSTPMPPVGERQTLMFSATFPPDLQKISADILSKDYMMMTVDSIGCANKCITQEFVQCERSTKRNAFFDLLKIDIKKYTTSIENEIFNQKTIVFVESKKMADMLGLQICESGIPCLTMHGDRLQNQRSEALREFVRGNKAVLVATAVAERGLDIKGVDHVINYDMPDNIDKYVHRIGRTGRVGNAGRATSLYDAEKDGQLAGDLVRVLKDAGQIVPDYLEAAGSSCFTSGAPACDDEW